MTILTRSDARRVIASHYPGMPFKIFHRSMSIGVRPVWETKWNLPTLAWRAVAPGRDSAVRIGILKPSGDVDWNAEVRLHDPLNRGIAA